MTGYQNHELGIIVAGFVLQSIACWVLIPWAGQMGAATASMLAIIFVWLARLWIIKRLFGIVPITMRAFYPFVVACVLAFGVHQSLTSAFDPSVLSTVIACVAVIGMYVAVTVTFTGLLRGASPVSD
jgi:O-antigen/teichoic acid export membrane protein